MVCVPCFIIPVLLFLWHKLVQPYVLRFWNPWAVTQPDGSVVTELPFKCEAGVCALSARPTQPTAQPAATPATADQTDPRPKAD